MTSTATERTPLAAAEAALADADAAVAEVEQENAPMEEKSSRFVEQLNAARLAGGADSKDALRAASGLNALAEKLRVGRQRLEQVQRRRTAAASRVESEVRAITIARQAISNQQQRVARQAEALTVARRAVAEKEIALDGEERQLLELRRQLAALTEAEGDL